jgi:hypothetical protein
MLVVALLGAGFQLVVAEAGLEQRALITAAVALIALVVGVRVGRRIYERERIRGVGWLPRTTLWRVDENGVRYAIVTQNSGDVVTVVVPAHLSREDATAHVLVELNERRRPAG